MAVTSTDAAARGILHDGVPTTFPAGSKLQYRTGAAPGASAVPTGTLVAEITLPATPWAAGSGRTVPKAGSWTVAAAAAGVVGYYRLITAGDTGTLTQADPRIEGAVTLTGAGGDLTMDNTNVQTGQTVTENTFAVSA